MQLCPLSFAIGCKKCPIFQLCPLKGVIGDHKAGEEAETASSASKDEDSSSDNS